MTKLSVNLNKIAVLRNSRGGDFPSVIKAAEVCIAAGCHGITVHPRPDKRHIHPEDVRNLKSMLSVELNIEGNPFAPTHKTYPGFVAMVQQNQPTQCTLVPDADNQITSDHGFNLRADAQRLKPIVAQLKSLGSRVSLFVDSNVEHLETAAEIGVDRIEIYTGPYAKAHAQDDYAKELEQCFITAETARQCGLAVNAGHDLNQQNLSDLLRTIPYLAEVSIGHALIAEALYEGLNVTVQNYLDLIRSSQIKR
jgi:pyridoxine 5-phosphate synthase